MLSVGRMNSTLQMPVHFMCIAPIVGPNSFGLAGWSVALQRQYVTQSDLHLLEGRLAGIEGEILLHAAQAEDVRLFPGLQEQGRPRHDHSRAAIAGKLLSSETDKFLFLVDAADGEGARCNGAFLRCGPAQFQFAEGVVQRDRVEGRDEATLDVLAGKVGAHGEVVIQRYRGDVEYRVRAIPWLWGKPGLAGRQRDEQAGCGQKMVHAASILQHPTPSGTC